MDNTTASPETIEHMARGSSAQDFFQDDIDCISWDDLEFAISFGESDDDESTEDCDSSIFGKHEFDLENASRHSDDDDDDDDYGDDAAAGARIIAHSASSLTDSSEDADDLWKDSYPGSPNHLPVTTMMSEGVQIEDDIGEQALSSPYAQLCFDPNSKSLVTLEEVLLPQGTKRRLRMLDFEAKEEPKQPKNVYDSAASTQEILSSFSWSSASISSSIDDNWDSPRKASLEETMVLLGTHGMHPQRVTMWDDESSDGKRTCADSLKKIFRQMIVPHRDNNDKPAVVSYEVLREP